MKQNNIENKKVKEIKNNIKENITKIISVLQSKEEYKEKSSNKIILIFRSKFLEAIEIIFSGKDNIGSSFYKKDINSDLKNIKELTNTLGILKQIGNMLLIEKEEISYDESYGFLYTIRYSKKEIIKKMLKDLRNKDDIFLYEVFNEDKKIEYLMEKEIILEDAKFVISPIFILIFYYGIELIVKSIIKGSKGDYKTVIDKDISLGLEYNLLQGLQSSTIGSGLTLYHELLILDWIIKNIVYTIK